jgi:hypothetical protein
VGAYWLDADVLIQAKNTFYSFAIARQFWDFLEAQEKLGTVRSSVKVYGEIMSYEDGHDVLAQWCKARRAASDLFSIPDKTVQEMFAKVADHVASKYIERPAKVGEFLKGADGWIVAHAKCDQGMVVTHEVRRNVTAKIPKIPNVCHDFNVGCIALPAMLEKLKFRFGK